jgi:hypothetical protein
LIFAPLVPDDDGVNVTPQLAVEDVADRKLQLVELKLPETPLVNVNPTEPVGTVAPTEDVSDTVAVHVEGWFTTTGVEQETLVAVECCPGVRTMKPELGRCVESAEYVAVMFCGPRVGV